MTKNNYRYFKRERMEWIGEVLRVFGFINRRHLTRKFWISQQQASADLKQFIAMYPMLLRYDGSKKCYVSTIEEKEEDDG